MNKFILLITIILITLDSAHSQSKPTALTNFTLQTPTRKLAKVHGKIINASPEELSKIKIEYTFVNLTNPQQSTYTKTVNADGTFEFEQTYNIPNQQVWFTLGKYVYSCLYLNENLELTFDLATIKKKAIWMTGEGITFEGKDGPLNKAMNEYILFDKKNNPDFNKAYYPLQAQNPNFQYKLDSLFAIQRKSDQDFYNQTDTTYKFIIDAETEAQYLTKVLQYYLTQKINTKNISSI